MRPWPTGCGAGRMTHRRGAAARHADGGGTRRGASGRCRASRLQEQQRHARPSAGRAAACRRHRFRAGGAPWTMVRSGAHCQPDHDRSDSRDAGLHGARAGRRRRADAGDRRLRARSGHVRDGHGRSGRSRRRRRWPRPCGACPSRPAPRASSCPTSIPRGSRPSCAACERLPRDRFRRAGDVVKALGHGVDVTVPNVESRPRIAMGVALLARALPWSAAFRCGACLARRRYRRENATRGRARTRAPIGRRARLQERVGAAGRGLALDRVLRDVDDRARRGRAAAHRFPERTWRG